MNKCNSTLHQFCVCTGYSATLFRLSKRLLKIVNCVLKICSAYSDKGFTLEYVEIWCTDIYWTGYSTKTRAHCKIIKLFNSVLKIFSVYAVIVLSEYVWIWKTDIHLTVYSAYTSVHRDIRIRMHFSFVSNT